VQFYPELLKVAKEKGTIKRQFTWKRKVGCGFPAALGDV